MTNDIDNDENDDGADDTKSFPTLKILKIGIPKIMITVIVLKWTSLVLQCSNTSKR